jgi:hypothetical protein
MGLIDDTFKLAKLKAKHITRDVHKAVKKELRKEEKKK